jgi:hypothetical protein
LKSNGLPLMVGLMQAVPTVLQRPPGGRWPRLGLMRLAGTFMQTLANSCVWLCALMLLACVHLHADCVSMCWPVAFERWFYLRLLPPWQVRWSTLLIVHCTVTLTKKMIS